MSFVFRAPREISPRSRIPEEMLAISESECSRSSGRVPDHLRRKSPIKGITASRDLSCDQSTLDEPLQTLLASEQVQRCKDRVHVGSVYKSYREWDADAMRSQCTAPVGPGPGSYILQDHWEPNPKRKPPHILKPQAKMSGFQRRQSNLPPDSPQHPGYNLCSLKQGESKEEKELRSQVLAKATEGGIPTFKRAAKGADFSSSNSKRLAFPINALTSLVGYPAVEEQLNYKCKKSRMFQGGLKRKMESNSERILRRLFCGSDQQPNPVPSDDRQLLEERTPNPCTYNLNKQYKEPSTHKAPFLTSETRPSFVNQKDSYIGPTSYSPYNQTSSMHASLMSSFVSQVERRVFECSSSVPPVGAYALEERMQTHGRGPMDITKAEGRLWRNEKQNCSPGPAKYANDHESIASKGKYNYQPQPNFRSKATRELFSKSLLEEKPGPGTYEAYKFTCDQELPESLQPKKTPFSSASPRFEPLRKEIMLIEEKSSPIERVHRRKCPQKQPKRTPFNNCSQRFPKAKPDCVPPVGAYYNEENDFRGWETTTFSKLFSMES